MNSIIRDHYETFSLYQALRNQLMEMVNDADLGYSPGGGNPTLGELCRENGEVETAYINSFRTFTLDFSYRHPDPTISTSVARLREWFDQLDAELRQAIEGLSEEDVQNRAIDRGGDFRLPPLINLMVYQEALLIFYGKTSVYLKALNKDLTEQWRDWIA